MSSRVRDSSRAASPFLHRLASVQHEASSRQSAPVAAASFNEKVLERREQNAVRTDPRSLACASCNKSFSSENAFRSHVQSKKHRDRETSRITQSVRRANNGEGSADVQEAEDADVDIASTSDDEIDSGDDEDVSEKIANFRRRIKPTDCLFCFQHSESVNENVIHMARSHSFFIPDQDILVDLPGLLSYLGEKVAIGNLCLFCPNGGREFGSLEAVRRHMIDKAHCKLAYNDEEDRVELADFYDFGGSSDDDDTEWEDMDVDGPTASATEVDVEKRPLGLAADGLSLMLPSGRTLGHRSLRVYYSQRYRPSALLSASEDSTALKVARVRQRLADSSLALVPVAGGHGAFGRGQELMKARNAGEAKWARRQARSFHDQRSKELHKTKMGFVHNSQKHFRDPLLQ